MDGSVFMFPVFAFLILSIFMGSHYFARKSAIDLCRKFAEKTGLSFNPGYFWTFPEVTGVYKGLDVHLYPTRIGGIAITMALPSIVKFSMNIYSPVSKLNGGISYEGQDIQTKNREFDKNFKIKSLYPDNVNEIITPEFCKEILLYKDFLVNILVDNRTITTEQGINYWINADKLADVTEIMWKMAHIIADIGEINNNREEI